MDGHEAEQDDGGAFSVENHYTTCNSGLAFFLLDQCLFAQTLISLLLLYPGLTCSRMIHVHLVVDPQQVSGASLVDEVSPVR